MEVRSEHIFDLDDSEDSLSVCQFTDSVSLSSTCGGLVDFRIDFRPVHIPELRELIDRLKVMQVPSDETLD